MVYGLEFQAGVIESLKALNDKEPREYTVREVLNFYIEQNKLEPQKNYLKTFKKRVWDSLKKWARVGWCTERHAPDSTRNTIFGYYKYIKTNG